MALMKISEFRESFTPKSRPTTRTVKKWYDSGAVAGKQYGSIIYIESDAIVPANDLVNKVLRDS